MKEKKWWLISLVAALALVMLSPLASTSPDGLEKVAEDKGFLDKAAGPLVKVIPDYLMPGISNQAASTIVAGLIGVLIFFGLTYVLSRLLRARSQSRNGEKG